MIAYFARRIVGGVVTLFLAGLVMYLLLTHLPGGALDPLRHYHHCTTCSSAALAMLNEQKQQSDRAWEADRPWPINFGAWLFDPDEMTEIFFSYTNVYQRQVISKGIDLTLGGLHMAGSGILTGDFGYSVRIDQGRPVLDMFGEGLGEFMLLIALTLPVSMGVGVVQRRRRPLVYWLPPNYPMSRNLLDRSLRPMRTLGL